MVTRIAAAIVHDEHAVEDIVQETFLKLWHHLSENHQDENLSAWLRTTTANLCRNHLHHQRIRDHDCIEEPEVIVTGSIADPGSPETRRRLDAVLRHIEGLPPQQQMVMKLLSHGHTLREIADIMDLAESTVRSYCNTARKKLKASLSDEASISRMPTRRPS